MDEVIVNLRAKINNSKYCDDTYPIPTIVGKFNSIIQDIKDKYNTIVSINTNKNNNKN